MTAKSIAERLKSRTLRKSQKRSLKELYMRLRREEKRHA